jgi:hypothetical protein
MMAVILPRGTVNEISSNINLLAREKLTPRTSTKFAIVWLIYGSFITLLTLRHAA